MMVMTLEIREVTDCEIVLEIFSISLVIRLAHDVAVRMIVGVSDGQLLDAPEKIAPHGFYRLLRELGGEPALYVGEQRRRYKQYGEHTENPDHRIEIDDRLPARCRHLSAHRLGRQIVERFRLHGRRDERDRGGGDDADDHDNEKDLIFSDVAEELGNGLFEVFRLFRHHRASGASGAASAGSHHHVDVGAFFLFRFVIQFPHPVSAENNKCRGISRLIP